jgi:hypothetical protein
MRSPKDITGGNYILEKNYGKQGWKKYRNL